MATFTTNLPNFDDLWDYDHPDQTEHQFRALLLAAEASGNQDYYLQLLTQIARTEGLQRRFDDAHQTLDTVGARLTDDLPILRVRYLLERGRVFNSSRRPAEGVPLFAAALELAQAHGEDFHAVDAAHMLGIAAPAEERLGWNLRALALAEASAQPRAQDWRGSLYNNIGWTYHDAGRYTEALAMFQQALAWHEAAHKPQETRIARWTVARGLRSLGRYEEALSLQQELLQEAGATGDPKGYGYEEIGECLLALGRADEARPYFAGAYTMLAQDPWLAENAPARLQRLHDLSAPAR
jgi:tetratricopeptide (TPR) repeat protein